MRRILPVALVLVLVGCAHTVPGTPTVSRPRDLDVEGVNSCTLLTTPQLPALGLTGVTPQTVDGDRNGVDRLCSWSGQEPRAIGIAVTPITQGGMSRYSADPERIRSTPITVQGFPGIVLTVTGHPEFCTVGLDLAAGQALDVQTLDGGRKPPILQPQRCDLARQAADAALTTLLAR